MRGMQQLRVAVLAGTVVAAMLGGTAASAASAAPRGRAFDPEVDVRTLTAKDVAGLTPADLPRLPRQVAKALTTPVASTTTITGEDSGRPRLAAAAALPALAYSEVCYTLSRDVWLSNAWGWHLMKVRNSARVCSLDHIYISEYPIDLSQSWGNWGWVFSSYELNSAGFCTSTHLKWYHVLSARFRYGLTTELALVNNETTFWGSGGISGGYC